MSAKRAGTGEKLLNLFFPARCLLCGERVPPGEAFCRDCRPKAPETPLERLYSLGEADGKTLRVLAAFSYEGGLRNTLYRFKFRGRKALARPLGRVMAQAVEGLPPFDCAVWVPLSKLGKRKRGYDQSQLLAKAVAEALGIPCLPLLEKVRETGIQHQLSKEDRKKNVKNAYGVKGTAEGLSLLLVDDIVTTGSTLAECAGKLYRAGAKKVVGLCAADAPAGRRKGEHSNTGRAG